MAELDNIETFNYEESKRKYLEVIQNKHHDQITYYPYIEESKNEFISFVKAQKKPYSVKYDVIKDSNNDELLILKRRIPDTPVVEVLPATKCFDVMAEIHLLEHHASCTKMAEILKTVYYIPVTILNIFIKSCNVCCSKGKVTQNTKSKVLNVNSHITPQFTVLCTILRLNSVPDLRFSHVIIYVDALTSYVLLRPTFSKDAHIVAYELLKIFLDFGLPENFIVNDNFLFYKKIMEILDSVDVFSSVPCIRIQTNLYRLDWVSETTDLLIKSWIYTRNSSNWAIGLKEIQWHLNNLLDYTVLRSRKLKDEIKSPFHAHFGFLPNYKVIEITNELLRTVSVQPIEPKKIVKTFEGNCLKCGKKIYELFYKTCSICKRKCHFNCCAINVVQSPSRYLKLEVTCHPCETKKEIE